MLAESWLAFCAGACHRVEFGCDPVLPKSKECAILTELLYNIEFIQFFFLKKILTAHR